MKKQLYACINLEKKSWLNLITGLSYQIISISMGLILPHLFITSLGSESNGLLSSVGQIFTCLGLLEAGVGAATIQALYKPIAINNHEEINRIITATNTYYKKTGSYYTVAVAILTLVYPFFIESSISSLTIRLVIILQGTGSIITYLFQAKYNLFLQAEGKNYIISIFSLLLLVSRNIGKIIAIQLGYNVVAVQAIQLVSIVLEALFIVYYVKSRYQWLSTNAIPDFNAISQKKSVLIQSAAWMVFNHTDILVLTVFTRNLRIISVYSVYLLIFESAQNVLEKIRTSFQYRIGNLAQKNADSLDCYYSMYSTRVLTVTLAIFTAVYLISWPFLYLYTKGITDADYYVKWVAELFFFYKAMYSIRALGKQLIEANGHFKQTEHIAVIECVSNVVISVFLVVPLGIYGVLIGSVISITISVILYYKYLSRNVVNKSIRSQIILLLMNTPIIVIALFIGSNRLLIAKTWINLILLSIIISTSCGTAYLIILKLARYIDNYLIEP